MPSQPVLAIRQETLANEQYRIRLTLKRSSQPDLAGEATMAFALTDQEQADLCWYLEEYLQRPQSTAAVRKAKAE